jgi:hypothetical protein
MRNRLVVTLALTAILTLGGTTFGKAPKPQNTNTNTSGTMSGSAKSGRSRKSRHHRRRHVRSHRKAAATTNANR